MANSKISALTSATTPLVGTETLPIVQGGATVKTTVADITNGGGYAGSFTTLASTGNTTLGDASTDTVRINGTLGIGGAALSNKAIQVQNTLSGSNPIGVDIRPVITATGGTIVAAFTTGNSGSLTANTGSAVSAYGCYLTEPNVIVTTGSVTNAATVFINEGPTEGGTLNANLYTNAATGTNKWNIYASGTASNYFAGNVGIGVSAPTRTLDVSAASATVFLTSSTGTNRAYYGASNTGGGVYFGRENSAGTSFGATAYASVLWSEGAYPLVFATNNTERMRIDSSGNAYIETGLLWQYAPTPTTKAAAATLTAAELATDIITLTGTTYTITLPTGTALDTYYTGVPAVNIGYDFHIVNTASGIITIAVGASGMTSVGLLTIAATVSAHFRLRRTAANTYILYRLS